MQRQRYGTPFSKLMRDNKPNFKKILNFPLTVSYVSYVWVKFVKGFRRVSGRHVQGALTYARSAFINT